MFFMFSCSEQDGALFSNNEKTVAIGQVWTIINDDPFFPRNDTIEIVDIKDDYALVELRYQNRKIRMSTRLDYISDLYELIKQ